MKLIAYQDDDHLWRWAIEGETGILLHSEVGYRKRDKALGQWQHLHRRLKKVERFEADPIGPTPIGMIEPRFDGTKWVSAVECRTDIRVVNGRRWQLTLPGCWIWNGWMTSDPDAFELPPPITQEDQQ